MFKEIFEIKKKHYIDPTNKIRIPDDDFFLSLSRCIEVQFFFIYDIVLT